jgi:hypothetical protein
VDVHLRGNRPGQPATSFRARSWLMVGWAEATPQMEQGHLSADQLLRVAADRDLTAWKNGETARHRRGWRTRFSTRTNKWQRESQSRSLGIRNRSRSS